MDKMFTDRIEPLAGKLDDLLEMLPLVYKTRPIKRIMPSSGVYLFSEGGQNLYVGRSNNLHGRYGRHCLPGATHKQACFAIRLAREYTGKTVPSYKPDENSIKGLMKNSVFISAFVAAKQRISIMEYRYVEEVEQTSQALLEIYAATVLGTRYNNFGTY